MLTLRNVVLVFLLLKVSIFCIFFFLICQQPVTVDPGKYALIGAAAQLGKYYLINHKNC
jgi:hypothetical protein